MHTHFPDIKPYALYRVKVELPHELYVEESGNPDGIPALFVHGGPGGGSDDTTRRYFDPEKYRIIVFDQRGAGRSTPHAGLVGNTTGDLIKDMEAIRLHLGVDRWLLFGGSWGSTLSLLYTQAHRERVLGLVLRGIFLCRKRDLEWFYQGGAGRLFPDYWADYVKPIPEHERTDFIAAYYRLLTGDNELARMGAAKAWSLWEAHCSTLRPNTHVLDHFGDPHTAMAMARIEAHYFQHQCFVEENQILNHVGLLEGIPGIIVHGRYDVVCPLDQAYELHANWPDAQLHIIRDAGHAATEPGTTDALVRATNEMAARL